MLSVIPKDNLADLWALEIQLRNLISEKTPEARVALVKEEADLLSAISKFMVVMSPMPVVLGHSRTKLADKVHALVHSFRSLAPTAAKLSNLFRSVGSICTDMGTELDIHRIVPQKLSDFLSDICAPSLDEFVAEPTLDLTASTQFPGPLHILHNISLGLCDQLKHFSEQVELLKQLSRLLTVQASKRALIESCFTSSAAKEYVHHIRGFTSKVNPKRFGTVARAVLQILPLELALQKWWSRSGLRAQQSLWSRGSVVLG